MHSVSVAEAGKRLDELVREAASGEEVVLTQENRPVVRLVAVTASGRGRKAGSARGRVRMADDFDAPLADFDEYR